MDPNQIGIAALTPLAIEWAKNSNLPFLKWINHGTVMASRCLAFASAAATAAGLIITCTDCSLWTPGTLTIGNLSAWTAGHFVWEMMKQMAMIEVTYRAAVRPEGPPNGASIRKEIEAEL